MVFVLTVAGLIVGIPLFILMIQSPYVATLLILFAIALEPMTSGSGLSLALVLGLAGGLAWFLNTMSAGKPIQLPPFSNALLAYIAAAILSIFAQDPGSIDWIRITFTYSSFFLIVLMIYNVLDTKEKLRGALQYLTLGFTVLIAISMVIFLLEPSVYARFHPHESLQGQAGARMDTGLTEVGHSENLTAKCLVTLFPIQVIMYTTATALGQVAVVVSVVLWLIGLFLIQSRGAALASIITVAAYIFLGQRSGARKWKQAGALGLLTFLTLAGVLANPAFLKRFNEPLTTRYILWLIALRGFMQHPVLGVGTGQYYKLLVHAVTPGLVMLFNSFGDPIQRYASHPGSPAHSFLINVAAETGMVGLTTFVWFLASVMWLAFRAFRRRPGLPPGFSSDVARGLFAGTLGFMAHSMVSGGEKERMLYVVAALIAVAVRLDLQERPVAT